MADICKLCNEGPSDWAEDDFESHLQAEHTPASVRAMYGGEYASVFEDTGQADAEEPGEEEPTEESQNEDIQSGLGINDTDSYGKKWYMIGVGGAGNNIIDAILLRQATLERNNEDRSHVWKGGLAGFGSINTNVAELEQTYYAQVVRDFDRADILSNAIIGFGRSSYSGAGYRWDIGHELMKADFEDGDPFLERWDMRKPAIRDAQAVMFLHSVTKGTGCGATPVLANFIREEILDDSFVVSKPMLSSVVLPSEGSAFSEFGGRAKTNGVVGLTRLSEAVDAIIPFDNARLQQVKADIQPRIENIEAYNPPQYAQLNRPMVAFLEAFTMSSIPQFLDREATMSIKGDVFDVADSFRPVEDKYSIDMDREFNPAVVLGPVLGRSRENEIDQSSLEILIRNALFHNRLADFEPKTAWGGTFLLYGPAEKMEHVSELVTDGTFFDIITGEDFLDAGDVEGVETVDINTNQLVIPYLEDVYLWGTLWNPKLPSLEKMYNHAKKLKEEGNSEQAENIREIWHKVEPLFSTLGRENMA